MSERLARVTSLRSFPVKSLDASALEKARVTSGGLDGDRTWAVVDPDGRVVSAREANDLRSVSASYDGTDVRVDVPGVGADLAGDDAAEALTRFLGRPVRLQRSEQRYLDVAAVLLVSRQAVDRARTIELEHDAHGSHDESCACSVDAPRANVELDLDDTAEPETAWVGREIALGDAVLRVTRAPKHCLGVYAEVVRPGAVSVGDVVTTG